MEAAEEPVGEIDPFSDVPRGPLSPEDCAWAMEEALASYTDRWNERLILEAASDEEALKAVLRYNSMWGRCGSDSYLEGRGNVITVTRADRRGTLTWREIVKRVRARAAAETSVQLSLFDNPP